MFKKYKKVETTCNECFKKITGVTIQYRLLKIRWKVKNDASFHYEIL